MNRSLRRHGQYLEKVNRGMILAPLVGIIVNLLDASTDSKFKEHNDIVGVFANMDCPETMHYGLQYMLEYNWVSIFIPNISKNTSCFILLHGILIGCLQARDIFSFHFNVVIRAVLTLLHL